jgi:hypothetical protein
MRALEESMPEVVWDPLNGDEEMAVAGLLEKAEVRKADFGTMFRNIFTRYERQHSVPEIDARDAVVDLERVVAEELRRPEFQPSATNPEVEGEWKVVASANPEGDEQANFTIKIGHVTAEPTEIIDILSSGIPDTIEGIEQAATPPTSPFISVEVTTSPMGEWRTKIESQLRGRGTPLGPDNNLQITEQQILQVHKGKLFVIYTWRASVDGKQTNIGERLSVPGDAENVQEFKLHLLKPRYYNEIVGWRTQYQANHQKPETPEEERS